MKPLIQPCHLSYPVRRILQSYLALCPGPGFSNRLSLGQPPSLHHLRRLRLNTWPIRIPVNASAVALLPPPHDSKPVWVATPSPYGLSSTTPCRFWPALSCQFLIGDESFFPYAQFKTRSHFSLFSRCRLSNKQNFMMILSIHFVLFCFKPDRLFWHCSINPNFTRNLDCGCSRNFHLCPSLHPNGLFRWTLVFSDINCIPLDFFGHELLARRANMLFKNYEGAFPVIRLNNGGMMAPIIFFLPYFFFFLPSAVWKCFSCSFYQCISCRPKLFSCILLINLQKMVVFQS